MMSHTKVAQLTTVEKQRYLKKIDTLGFDPYLVSSELLTSLKCSKNLPNLTFADIYIYLVHNPSPYTGEALKAFKSTEAYRYFTSGWVNDPKMYHLEMKKMFLIIGKVKHSQSLGVTPTHPWITVQEDGTVLMAHCTCKAGLGEVQASGFIINPDLPWIGASPDGMVTCTCHADGVLEIKCPFNSRDCSLAESCKDPSFCLGIGEDGTMALKTGHKFMYQVQAQMHVATVSYCDFVVWTPQEFFLQRIQYDPVFFHNAYLKVVEFIKTGVLPELLGKWYTAPRHTPTDTATTEHPPELGCYCGKPGDTDDITCTSAQCKRKHFHRSCLQLSRVPKTWKCVECRKKVYR